MAKNTIRDLDTTAALNTDIGGVDIRGTAQASNIDDAIRYMAKILADLNEGNEPIEDRFGICDPDDSTKVMRFDVGSISTGETRVISVPDEDFTMVPDALSKSAGGTLQGNVIFGNNVKLNGEDAGGTQRAIASITTSDVLNIGGNGVETSIFAATKITLETSAESTGIFTVAAKGETPTPNSNSSAERGAILSQSAASSDIAIFNSHGNGRVMTVNRMDGDGTLIGFRTNGSTQGSISVSSGTVTYGSFLGTHYSENVDGDDDILIGTIVESVDDFVDHNFSGSLDRMPKFKISDTPNSTKVYGAVRGRFLESNDDGEQPSKASWWVQGVGIGHIRLSKNEKPKTGDAIVSAGDGTGKVLPSTTPMTVGVHASIVAHIKSANHVITHYDGSKVYSCTFRKG